MASNDKKRVKIKTIKTGVNLTIDEISKIYRELLSEIDKSDSISLESDEIKNIDVTGIQFLHYAKQISENKNISISFNLNFSPETTNLLIKTGFSYLLN